MNRAIRLSLVMVLFSSLLSGTFATNAQAITFNVTATGTNPSVCNQIAGTAASVSAVRLSGGDCVVTITGNTSWQIPYSSSNFQFLIVGGGAAGQIDGGGGGGGGGSLYLSSISLTTGVTANIEIGAGGNADSYTGGGTTQIDLNGDSSFDWNAPGGNLGTGWVSRQGGTGGSPAAQGSATVTTGGSGAAGPASTNWQTAAAGTAGNGYNSSITGTSLYYGGGGGGGIGSQSNGTTSADLGPNAGGSGGGGAGAAQRSKGTSVTWSYVGTGGGTQSLTANCVGAAYAGSTTGFDGLNGFGGGGGGGSAYGDGCSASPNTTYDGERNRGGFGGSGVAIFRFTPDTSAPTFTSTPNFSSPENTAITVAAATIKVSESATVTISSGADAALFTISFSDTVTALIKFKVSPNYEAPSDSGANNVYDLVLTATDTMGNAGNQTITITVTDVVDTSSFNSFSLSGTPSFRTVVTITANISVAAKVTFRAKNVIISGCKNKLATGSGSSFTATCSWKPSIRGAVTITASAVPTGAGISSSTANPLNVRVENRSGSR